jgi:hypothetical protein
MHMVGIDTITLTISLVSISISVLTAYKSYRFAEHQSRLNARRHFQPLLLDTNKAMIAHPELCAFYDSSSIQSDPLNPVERARLEAYAHMLLNTLEIIFAFYGDSARLTKAERESFEAWKRFLRDTLERSSLARELWNDPNIKPMYNSNLVAEIESAINSKVR